MLTFWCPDDQIGWSVVHSVMMTKTLVMMMLMMMVLLLVLLVLLLPSRFATTSLVHWLRL